MPTDIWEDKKAVITRLYKDEEWPLKHVIKMIQTRDFRPRETQLRARLKKWHVTKSARKPYSSRRRSLAECEHRIETTTSNCPSTLDADSITGSPGDHDAAGLEHHEHPLADRQNDTFDYSLRQLDILQSPFQAYLTSTSSSTGEEEQTSTLPIVTEPHTADDTIPTTASLSGAGQEFDLNGMLSTTNSNNELSQQPNGRAEYENSAQKSRQGNITSVLDLPRDDLAMSSAIPSPDISTSMDSANMWDYQLGQWAALQFPTALAQYQAGLALCKGAIPRLAQQEWKRLQQHLSTDCAQFQLPGLPGEYNLFQDEALMPHGLLLNNDSQQTLWS